MKQRRIASTTSRTAGWTCLSRAVSSLEKNPCYHSDDTLAYRLLPNFFRMLLRIPHAGRLFVDAFAAVGAYEYIVARTKFIDSIFRQALTEKFDQIVLLGAGYDTRALRFQELARGTHIFELDAPLTQEAKIGQYHRRGLAIPDNLTFVPADFEKEGLADMLDHAGFQKGMRSLFVLEGLLMYLQPETVHETFKVIHRYAGKGSQVVFDYVLASVLRGEGIYAGEERFRKLVISQNESWNFGIEQGGLASFLSENGLKLIEYKDTQILDRDYFTDASGHVIAHVTGTHALVWAEIE